MKKRWLLALGLVAFVATAVGRAPAAWIHAWTLGANDASPLQVYGIHGVLAEGGAAGVSLNGRPILHEVRWTLRPWWLPLLRLTADLETRGKLEGRLTVSRSVFGRLQLSDLQAVSPIKNLLATAVTAALPVEGQARLTVASARFEDGLPVQVDGLAEVQGLAWTLARDPILLGDYNANLTTDDKGVLAQLASGAGPVELSGEARLMPDRSWDLHLQLKPRSGASPQIQALVQSLGAPDSAGWYHLRRRGNL